MESEHPKSSFAALNEARDANETVGDQWRRSKPMTEQERKAALNNGITEIYRNEIVSCPQCKGEPTLGDGTICIVCKGTGKMRIQQFTPNSPTSYVALDGTKVIDAPIVPAVRELNATIQDLQEHFAQLITQLGFIRAGMKKYHVPITFKSALDGGLETTIREAWGRTAQEAGQVATHDAQRNRWAKVTGEIKLVDIGAPLTEEWIAKALSLTLS